ncbi:MULTISPECIES: hypothetical protein [unclassified Treponema]|uniref:hypothetical protein n=1 Tax=unclassified Treponema TaxID=2638727 RepID=UPI0020A3A8ED|nr:MULTISPECIES: hypothetical protein [unclassified Treponema]UTC68311.1 hypothetical protein E4O06_06695 [Treponema sp. OMZ 789]UTC71032.1 hypothetical protein E4O01_06840 [Treponema sp. OMZ 790]UTC73773.1 hypothetical protein E4O02_07035 [Treponema sp. OMZ 791]
MIKGKIMRKLCCFILILALFQGYAHGFAQENGKSIKEIRIDVMDFYRSEISSASMKEISADNLGVWQEVLNASLFMLIRNNELYRGRMRLIVEENQIIKCEIYPDGTVLVSTGLFDYIEARIAENLAASPRRIKNLNMEREKMLSAFLADAAASFALDNKLVYFSDPKRSEDKNKELLKSYNLAADNFALILLKLAGYDSNIFYNHLEELKRIQTDPNYAKRFETFFTDNFLPQQRISNLLKHKDEAEAIADEIYYILDAIRNDNENAIEDAKQRVSALRTAFPNNIYFKRLAAIITHKKWESSIIQKTLLTAYPAAAQNSKVVDKNYEILNFDPKSLLIDQRKEDESDIPGNINDYDEAVRAYNSYLNSIQESGMESAYAVLLFYSTHANDKTYALSLAEKAALSENGTGSLVASANYASLLYLSQKDYTKSKIILESMIKNSSTANMDSLFLITGSIIDQRLIIFNYARVLFGLGEVNKAFKAREQLRNLIFSMEKYAPIILKKIKLEDTTDDLIEYWGKPSGIKYNYFSEKWYYDFLNAEVSISTATNNNIEKISIFAGSNLSLPNDLRIGESRKSFESFFGPSLYISGDLENYFYKANKIQVFYLNGFIRQIFITKLES